jgi:hypothetical protein
VSAQPPTDRREGPSGCGEITDRFEHCRRRPSPMFPQLDESEHGRRSLVQVVDDLWGQPRMKV